jgi:predicted transcriptional regulator
MTDDKTKLRSYSYLSKLYATSGAFVLNPVKGVYRLAMELGVKNEETDVILEFLKNEGLAIIYLNEDKIAITNKGIRAVEEAELNPVVPSKYFPAIMEVKGFEKSDESQRLGQFYELKHDPTIGSSKYKELRKSTELIRNSIDKLYITPELKSKLRTELITIDVQIAQPKPDAIVIKECVGSIKSILENASDSLLVRRLLSQLTIL